MEKLWARGGSIALLLAFIIMYPRPFSSLSSSLCCMALSCYLICLTIKVIDVSSTRRRTSSTSPHHPSYTVDPI